MTSIELWFWTITDEITGRRRRTRHRMTEAEALERHGADAQKVDGTLEVRAAGEPGSQSAAHLAKPTDA